MEETTRDGATPTDAGDTPPAAAVRGGAASRVLLNIASVCGCLLTSAYLQQPDDLTALTVIPAWCWLLAAAILLLETRPVLRSWPWLACLAVTVLYSTSCVEQVRSMLRGPFRLPEQASGEAGALRVVTLNCLVGTAEVLEDLRRWQPDLVLLQESPTDATLQSIASELFGEAGTHVSTGDCSILARGLLELIPGPSRARFVQADWTPLDGPRTRVVSLRLSPPPTRIDLWRPECWRQHRMRRELHHRQVAQLAAELVQVPAAMPVIVGGDFNSPASDASHSHLRPRLEDSYALAGRGWGQTFSRNFPFHRLDQIWLSSEFRPLRTGAMFAEHSDHRATICDVARPVP